MQQLKCSEGKGLLRNQSAQSLDFRVEKGVIKVTGHHLSMSHGQNMTIKTPKVSSAEINCPVIMHCAGKTSSVF